MVIGLTSSASAGIPECGNLRLEDVANCDIRADAECMAGCDRLGVYEVACATRLETVCRSECTLSATPTCTDSCTVMCQAECDAGVSITCQHNCFGECTGVCVDQCAGAANPSQCQASCEATCDGECDIQCAPVVDESCYVHCIECCDGSCGAQANMDCQVSCQEVQFEDCEHEFQADCSASCSVDGALFCDDEFVLAGADVPACVDALIARGIGVEAEASVTLGPDGVSAGAGASVCTVSAPGSRRPRGAVLLGMMAIAGLWFGARRRR
ncbi:MAG: hypothetical protein JRH11_26335 [Deltaproteobacteria bacterium]|nr:hypothetical protein [Deltaproteobacteria bacterium]